MAYGSREYYNARFGSLRTERDSGWIAHWRDISEFMMPRLSRFLVTDRNKGDKRNQKINDNTATLAVRVAVAGLLEGLTSRSRPWIKLRAPDPDLNDFKPVKVWLDLAASRMQELFLRSNLYTTLPLARTDELLYGTTAYACLDDYEDMIRCYHFPIGSYALATSERGIVDVCYREFSMTVRQMVQKFGYNACSAAVKSAYDQKSGAGLETWITVVHAIEPNLEYDPRRQQFSMYKRFHSCYYEQGVNEEKKLRESGFDRFRVLAPRWTVTGEDTYGSSPGMDVLGDVRALQFQQKRKAQLIEKGIMPPLQAPSALANAKVSQLPGDVTFYDQTAIGQKIEPVIDVSRFPYQWLLEDIAQTQQRIKRGLFEDLFLMFSRDPRAQPPTAREVAERHEEKLWALGPVIERDNDEHLDPLIDIGFEAMIRNEALPDPPRELQGQLLGVEYISILAQAMKLVGVSGLERGTAFITGLAGAGKPDALDLIDTYEVGTAYWDMVGATPQGLRDRKTFEAIQQKKLEDARNAQMGALLPAGAQVAKTLSETKLDDDNVLARMTGAQ